MSFKKIILGIIGLLFISISLPKPATAQWGIGGSYEIRDEEPENGFGFRLQRSILKKAPIVDLAFRAHFSYFSDENQVNPQDPDQSTYGVEITDYDFGLTAIGGVSVGLLKPYVGLGLGSNTVDLKYDDVSIAPEDKNESKVHWNALVGAEVSALPLLKPFVEYRFTKVGDEFFQDVQSQNIPSESNGRIIFGVLLTF